MRIKQNTWPALEILKALAIIAMIFIHSWGWILTEEDLLIYGTKWSTKIANALHFLCFFDLWIPALAGASLRVQFDSSASFNSLARARSTANWGLTLLFSAFVLELFLGHPYPVLAYNPLHFLGYSFLIIAFLLAITPYKFFSVWTLVFFCVSIMKSHLFEATTFPQYETYETILRQSPNQVLRFYFNRLLFAYPDSGWGLIPWFSSILVGFSLAQRYIEKPPSQFELKIVAFFSGFLSFLFLFSSHSLDFISRHNILSQYSILSMPNSLFIACILGFVFLLSLLTLFFSKDSKTVFRFLIFFSRGSFWIFFIQFPIGYAFTPLFFPFNYETKLFLFPLFIFVWCGIFGYFILELAKKRLRISFTKTQRTT